MRDKRVEIGWTWFGPEFWGKGLNIQVKSLMLKYCFEVLDFERVEFKTVNDKRQTKGHDFLQCFKI